MGLDLSNLPVVFVHLLMSMSAVMVGLPDTALLTGAGPRSIYGELFQHERAPEMQRHLGHPVSFRYQHMVVPKHQHLPLHPTASTARYTPRLCFGTLLSGNPYL